MWFFVLLLAYSHMTLVCLQLHNDPNIVIAKMNAVDNDVPLGYDVQG